MTERQTTFGFDKRALEAADRIIKQYESAMETEFNVAQRATLWFLIVEEIDAWMERADYD